MRLKLLLGLLHTDWLDNGNNKKAFQEADKVLKKQPKLQCAKVSFCFSVEFCYGVTYFSFFFLVFGLGFESSGLDTACQSG